jgi:hypothetical protein
MKRYLGTLVLLLGPMACVQQPLNTANDPNAMQAQKPQVQHPSSDAPSPAAELGDRPSPPAAGQTAQPAAPPPGGSPAPPPAPGVPSSIRSGGADSQTPNVPDSMPQPDPL